MVSREPNRFFRFLNRFIFKEYKGHRAKLRLNAWASLVLWLILTAIITFSYIFFYYQTNAVFKTAIDFNHIVFLNIVPIVAISGILSLISRNVFIGMGVEVLILGFLALASDIKLTYRSDPVNFLDIFALKETMNIGGNFDLRSYVLPAAVIVFVSLLLFLGAYFIRTRKLRIIPSLALIAIICFAGYIFCNEQINKENFFVYPNNEGVIQIGDIYNRPLAANTVLPLVYLINSYDDLHVDKPVGYSKKKLEGIVKDYQKKPNKPKTVPNIIFVQLEAFTDLSNYLTFEDPNYDPLEFTNSLKDDEDALTGHLYVSNVGGGTFQTEMNVLTGTDMPVNLLGHYINKDTDSLNKIYDSDLSGNIIHPYHGWFWNRKNVYEKLGYDAGIYLENGLDKPENQKGFWVSNDAAYETYIANHKNQSFSTIVTMQNHGGYDGLDRYKGLDVKSLTDDMCIDGNMTHLQSWENYFFGVRDDDKLIENLWDYFETGEGASEPTIIVYYGDHLPGAPNMYELTSFNPGNFDKQNEDLDIFYRTVPFGILPNTAALEQLDLRSKFDELRAENFNAGTEFNANYLGAMLYELIGSKQDSPWFNFLNHMRRNMPLWINGIIKQPDGTLGKHQSVVQEKLIQDYTYWNYHQLTQK